MISETSLAARQCRLREWAAQIRECQNRAQGISIIEWCSRNGLTKANYYYRLRRAREAFLEQFPEEAAHTIHRLRCCYIKSYHLDRRLVCGRE